MKKFLTVTIDVEPDCTTSWHYSSPLAFEGVRIGIKERLQPLFNNFGIPPTYLINNVVLEDESSCKILSSLDGDFELGTHLHPEFIEPNKMFDDYSGRKGEANCCFLEPEVEFKKIESITNLFIRRFGYSPQSFRAGRFSAGTNTIQSLARLGYRVDTSVTPNVCWDDRTRERPVDFRSAPQQPYFMSASDITKEDENESVLQVPVSIVPAKASFIKEIKRTRFGLRGRIRSVAPQWLRPRYSSTAQLLDTVKQLESKYASNDVVVFNMMFHNVEVMPGLSPYSKTEADCEYYLAQLKNFFGFCNENGIKGIKLGDVYGLFR